MSEHEQGPPERQNEEEAKRYPQHEDPDRAREDAGLDQEREPEPGGAPPPPGGND